MVRVILILLVFTLIFAGLRYLNQKGQSKSSRLTRFKDINKVDDPVEAATALMVAIARMDTIGKITPAQSQMIAGELQTHMGLSAGDAKARVKNIRNISRHLNRPQSMGPIMTKVLNGRLTETEITDLTAMMTRIAEKEGAMNRDQMEFITSIRDALENPTVPTDWHLAQINIAFFKAPKFNTANDDFHNAIDQVNEIAESAPGFIWRLVDDESERVGIDLFRDPDMIINMSVWEDMESLSAFVYRDKEHRAVMRRKAEWFKHMDVYMALWWIKAGETPTLKDAAYRLDLLASRGATEEAFTFKAPFPKPDDAPDYRRPPS